MQIKINNSRWYNSLWAAFCLFTKFPLEKVYRPPMESYRAAMEFWPLAGWLTASLTAAVIMFSHGMIPYPVTLLLALSVNFLLTGTDDARALAHIAARLCPQKRGRAFATNSGKPHKQLAVGLAAAAAYTMALLISLYLLPPVMASMALVAAGPFAKMVAAQLIMMMPPEQTPGSQNGETTFRQPTTRAAIILAIQGLLPMAAFVKLTWGTINWQYIIFVPCVVMYFLYLLVWHRLRGYSLSSCRAVAAIVELSVYATIACSTNTLL